MGGSAADAEVYANGSSGSDANGAPGDVSVKGRQMQLWCRSRGNGRRRAARAGRVEERPGSGNERPGRCREGARAMGSRGEDVEPMRRNDVKYSGAFDVRESCEKH